MIVYIIHNLVNGKYYIGKTIRPLEIRFKQHISDSFCKSRKVDPAISRAIRKYGKENFIVEVLSKASSVEQLNELEKLWIVSLSSYGQCYNMTFGGDGGYHPSKRGTGMKGRHHTSLAKINIGEKNKISIKLKWQDADYRRTQLEARCGYIPSEKHRASVSQGIKKSWEVRRKKYGANGRRST